MTMLQTIRSGKELRTGTIDSEIVALTDTDTAPEPELSSPSPRRTLSGGATSNVGTTPPRQRPARGKSPPPGVLRNEHHALAGAGVEEPRTHVGFAVDGTGNDVRSLITGPRHIASMRSAVMTRSTDEDGAKLEGVEVTFSPGGDEGNSKQASKPKPGRVHPPHTLWVGNIPLKKCNSEDMKVAFGAEKVANSTCRQKVNGPGEEGGENKSWAFVTFASEGDVVDVLTSPQGVWLDNDGFDVSQAKLTLQRPSEKRRAGGGGMATVLAQEHMVVTWARGFVGRTVFP